MTAGFSAQPARAASAHITASPLSSSIAIGHDQLDLLLVRRLPRDSLFLPASLLCHQRSSQSRQRFHVMGFTCDHCGVEPAQLHCFADRASLCRACDSKLHTASKAAQKHERVALAAHKEQTQCDICQEQPAVMFCAEDRALICRRCDMMIHTANEFTKTHHRYILSGFTCGLHGLPEASSSGAAGSADTTARRSTASAAMPGIARPPSSGDLLEMPKLPTGAALMGAPSMGAPNPLDGAAAAAGPGAVGGSSSAATAAVPSDAGGSSSSHDGVTLAADLLGMPALPDNYSAKDVDAAWGDAGLGDFDDWSSFLEVPDLGFLPETSSGDWFGPDAAAAAAAEPVVTFDPPTVSVRDPSRVSSTAAPAMSPLVAKAPLAAATAAAAGAAGGSGAHPESPPKDSLVPVVPAPKRQRV